ncbi:hypothetical protein J2S13_002955 [Oikeobacillus pervagus]|uniref:Uncharacterized protein n=1 Tax=Oikeobacillus pervagus TaxID=1325931 RepID=A0AAJ1WK88_9BACI|nr:hypothetical protein [Oikeobacillus pervagus]
MWERGLVSGAWGPALGESARHGLTQKFVGNMQKSREMSKSPEK